MYESSKTLVKQLDKIGDKLANVVEGFQRNKIQEMAEVEIEIDPTVEVETIQGTTTGMEVEITTTEIEVEIVEAIIEIEIEEEEETDLIPEKEEEINLYLDQVKDTLTEMNSA